MGIRQELKDDEAGVLPRVMLDGVTDVLYVTLGNEPADKSIQLDHGVIVRYAKGVPVGVTIVLDDSFGPCARQSSK